MIAAAGSFIDVFLSALGAILGCVAGFAVAPYVQPRRFRGRDCASNADGPAPDPEARDSISTQRRDEKLRRSPVTQLRMSARMEAAREAERKRIASELHDELGQTLTALRMNVALLREELSAQGHPGVRRLKTMTELVDRTIGTTRHIIASLRPPALNLGIAAALEWLVDECGRHSGVRCSLRMDDEDIDLDEQRSVTVFRIVQEALTNAVRHACATRVEVVVTQAEAQLRIDVSDDGNGFDPRSVNPDRSFGLAAMRERVLGLDGTFLVQSMPGQGAHLSIAIPLPPAAPGITQRACEAAVTMRLQSGFPA